MADVLLTIGTRKGLWLARSADGRATWQVEGPMLPMEAVYATAIDTRADPVRVLASAENGHWGPSVFHSDDLGATWHEPDAAPVSFPDDTGAALTRVWQLQPAPVSQPGVVYAGTEPAALFRSADGGLSFSLVRGLWDHPHRPSWQPGGGGQCLHTVVPHPTDPDQLAIAISAAGVYRTTDGGDTWTASNTGIMAGFLPEPAVEFGQCVHKVAMHPDRPDQLFLQHHGGVYRSDDGGEHWSDISAGLPADFGFPVVAHPHRPGEAFVFPLVGDFHRMPPEGRARVYRTPDAGATWEELGDGLPDGAWFSVLRDAMCADDADPAGLYLGTRTGEVFGSADEGRHWASIVRHLPDVLSVRAAVVG